MIYVGADHRGFPTKEIAKETLSDLGLQFTDLGTDTEGVKSDFPDFAFLVGEAVSKEDDALGILSCGSAGGMVIAANKVRGIRAVHAMTPELAVRAREHDDANVLIVDNNFTDEKEIPAIVTAFLESEFDAAERRVRRREKITDYEAAHNK